MSYEFRYQSRENVYLAMAAQHHRLSLCCFTLSFSVLSHSTRHSRPPVATWSWYRCAQSNFEPEEGLRRNGVLRFVSQYKCDAYFQPLRHGSLGEFLLHTLSSMHVLSTYLGDRVLRKKVASNTWTDGTPPLPPSPWSKVEPISDSATRARVLLFYAQVGHPVPQVQLWIRGIGGSGAVPSVHVLDATFFRKTQYPR